MDRIRKALLGGHPLLYVLTWEESRVERLAQHLAKTFYGAPVALRRVVGRRRARRRRQPGAGHAGSALKALEAILAASGKGFYLMKDFPTAGDGVRRSSAACATSTGRSRSGAGTCCFVSPRLAIPEDVKKEIYVVEYELPDDAEISKILDAHLRRRLGDRRSTSPRCAASRSRCVA